MRVSSRGARFQEWSALLGNRSKRQRRGEFIVQGVRPVTLAIRHGWPVRELLYNADAELSRWARETLDSVAADHVAVSAALLAELGGKDDGAPELLAVVALPGDELSRIPAEPGLLAVVFDRPASPGNIGTLIRSADAFGASGVIVTGHAADIYDPRSVRASTGSLFALPVVRAQSHRPVLEWAAALRAAGTAAAIIGADETARRDAADVDLTGPALLLIGNEATGLTAGWREACDELARIPMLGAASSLNAATAASVLLYESARQRIAAGVASPRPGASPAGA
jgi:tRNA G18 (ribose-2'-O)-methylase SpoU